MTAPALSPEAEAVLRRYMKSTGYTELYRWSLSDVLRRELSAVEWAGVTNDPLDRDDRKKFMRYLLVEIGATPQQLVQALCQMDGFIDQDMVMNPELRAILAQCDR